MILEELEIPDNKECDSVEPKIHNVSIKTRKTGAVAIQQPLLILTEKDNHNVVIEVVNKIEGTNGNHIKKTTSHVNLKRDIDSEKSCNDNSNKGNSDSSNKISSEIVKKNSATISVPDEIKRSLSRTKLLSISVIKNIFKKSKRLNDNSKSVDPVVPNFIFKYSREEFVDDELPHSAKYGFFRLCCTTFAISLNTLICGIILGFTFAPDFALLSMLSSTDCLTQKAILDWAKYAFVGGCLRCLTSVPLTMEITFPYSDQN